ncbi:hypothetical protein [Ruegeria sp. B32]|uniref:hypothetical protein n=1 Tax=Ruegeria sp. B32 TaxID=2867020 RepID=UPI0021A6A647|nr:hypothetical protein [Ruegeria sp. B32]UWR08298.1 hypothetical protein K3752_04845 [Ruegeria sp. B32]
MNIRALLFRVNEQVFNKLIQTFPRAVNHRVTQMKKPPLERLLQGSSMRRMAHSIELLLENSADLGADDAGNQAAIVQ